MEKKLLFVASTRAHICHFHLPYLRQFKADGWTVHAACGGEEGEIPYCDHVMRLPLRKRMLAPGNFRSSRRLRERIMREGYGTVIVHTSLAAFFTRLAVLGMKDRPAVINMVHGYLFDERTPRVKRGVLLLAEKLTAPVTDLVITMNQCDREIARKHRLGRETAFVPGVGVDFAGLEQHGAEDPQTLRRSLGIRENDFVLICPAEFSKRKQQSVLIRAMTMLPENAVLVLPGDGKKRDACIKLARKLKVRHRIHFPGYVEKITPWYQMADAAVFSSRSEGLPFSLMEAMYFGLPAVASDVKGHTDLIRNGKNGLVCPCGDHAACAGQIKWLMEHPDLARSMAEAAAENVRRYALPVVLPQVLELYRNAAFSPLMGE
jgi:glycosyltransferase EpsD